MFEPSAGGGVTLLQIHRLLLPITGKRSAVGPPHKRHRVSGEQVSSSSSYIHGKTF